MGQLLSHYYQQYLPLFSTCTNMLMVGVLRLLLQVLALWCGSAILPNVNLHAQAQDTQCSESVVVARFLSHSVSIT